MRRAFWALALIGASFAGGAAANNRATLEWAKEWFGVSAGPEELLPGLMVGGSDEGDAEVTSPESGPGRVELVPRAEFPNAPVRPPWTKAESEAIEAVPVERVIAPPPKADGPSEAAATGSATPVPDEVPPAIEPLRLASLPPSSAQSDTRTGTDPPQRVDAAVAPVSRTMPSLATVGEGWASVRHRMAELGVRRYWVEGEPLGMVRFRCVIPLAGERAVGQQFEAEGDDELQAAEAVLRRIALWKATEPS